MTRLRRLLDDPELARELRGELEALVETQADYDAERGLSALAQRLGAEATRAPEEAPVAERLEASGVRRVAFPAARAPLGTKWLLVAAIGGTTALGIHAWQRSGLREPPPEAAPQSAPAPAAAAPAPDARAAAPEAVPETTPVAPSERTLPAATPSKSEAASPSRREIAQLLQIKAWLERDPARARRLIRAAQREFPSGVLVEEREGLDVIALYAIGPAARARVQAERFIARYPRSPLRARIERLLETRSE